MTKYEVTNVGVETAEQVVEVGLGEDATNPRGYDAVILDITELELEGGETKEVTITQELTEAQVEDAPQEVAVITEDDAATVPIITGDTADLTFVDQALGTDENGNDAVFVFDVAAQDDHTLVITDDSDERNVVGTVELDQMIGEDVIVPVNDLEPGDYVTHITDDPDNIESSDESVSDGATIVDADVTIEDQNVESSADEVVVAESDLQPETEEYMIAIHDFDEGALRLFRRANRYGERDPRLCRSDR